MPETGDVIKIAPPVRLVPMIMDDDRVLDMDPAELVADAEHDPILFLPFHPASAFCVSPARIYVFVEPSHPPGDRKTIFHVPSPSAVLCL